MIIKSKFRLNASPYLLNDEDSKDLANSWREYTLSSNYFFEYIKPNFKKYVFDIRGKKVYKSIIRDRITSKRTDAIIMYYCVDTNNINTATKAIFYSELVVGNNRQLFSITGHHQQAIVKSVKYLSKYRHFAVSFLLALVKTSEIPVMLLTDFSQTKSGRQMFINFLQEAIIKNFDTYFGFSDSEIPFAVKITHPEDIVKYYPKFISNNTNLGFSKRCAFVLNKNFSINRVILHNVEVYKDIESAIQAGKFTYPKAITEQEYDEFTNKY